LLSCKDFETFFTKHSSVTTRNLQKMWKAGHAIEGRFLVLVKTN